MTRRPPAIALALVLLAPPAFTEEGFEAALKRIVCRIKGYGKEAGRPAAPPQAAETLRVVSWNLQVFGGRKMKDWRRKAFRSVLDGLTRAPGPIVFAFQEVPNQKASAKLLGMMSEPARWTQSFEDTSDGQDNGLMARGAVKIGCERSLPGKHQARLAHLSVGDLDFTMVSVHLTFAGGDRREAARELGELLDAVEDIMKQPGSDPDVLVAGDFNLVARGASKRGPSLSLEALLSERRRERWAVLIDEPTTHARNGGNSYDHFLMSADLATEEFIPGSAAVLPEGTARFPSDHAPIGAALLTSGEGADGRAIGKDGAGTCSIVLASR